jgi:hypothetical protein
MRQGLGDVGDAQFVEQLLAALQLLRTAEIAARLQDRHQILSRLELAEHRRLLRQIAQAAPRACVHRPQRDVLAVER